MRLKKGWQGPGGRRQRLRTVIAEPIRPVTVQPSCAMYMTEPQICPEELLTLSIEPGCEQVETGASMRQPSEKSVIFFIYPETRPVLYI